ncbi:MAG: hypothetical protein HQL23_02535 [Candidatus Omnitrophica bacterium]|nr:hypothetical protein [Candidatus Omnitrophota bacterium]
MLSEQIKSLEKEAQKVLEAQKYEDASKLFLRAAQAYQELGQHQEAALSFSSAAGCSEFQAGKQSLFYYAADYYEKAAKEAELAADFEYASMLYKHAGICYERDLEYVGFSECFYLSKECYRRSLLPRFWLWQRPPGLVKTPTKFDLFSQIKRIFAWFSLTVSAMVWGHGERPHRTFIFGFCLMFCAALVYTQGQLMMDSVITKPSFLESIYFSYITVTRIGYGDIVPIGFNKVVALCEEFIGIFLIPIFITGLCRKYLRFW